MLNRERSLGSYSYIGMLEGLEERLLYSVVGNVVINEVMYHPSSEDVDEEFVELYNRSDLAVNLFNWRLTSGIQFQFENIILGAGEFLVVAADVAKFTAKYGDVGLLVVGGWEGRLSNSGETINLRDELDVLVDDVKYADEGDWAERVVGVEDRGHNGWDWFAGHDGGGYSLSLINADIENDYGQNWGSSLVLEGTPGAMNGLADDNIAPMILDLAHLPMIPRSGQAVTVTAKIIDELASGTVVTLWHRVDGAENFDQTQMFDNGLLGDDVAGDGVFGAVLPGQSDLTVVEFYVRAVDASGESRVYAAGGSGGDGEANLLYQVDDTFAGLAAGEQPTYRIIMTEVERAELEAIGDAGSNESLSHAQMNGTFVSVDGRDVKVRYAVGIRNRGQGSRNINPNNYRVNFSSDHLFSHGVAAINFNSDSAYLQTLGAAIFRLGGLVNEGGAAVQIRVNGVDTAQEDLSRTYGSYNMQEVYDSSFAERRFSDDANGNLYKAASGSARLTNLDYRGDDPASYYSAGYRKTTNASTNDWTDLIDLTFALNESGDDVYLSELERVANVDQWLRWLAMHALIGNDETNIGNGVGDDFSLYRGVDDARFVLLSHDFDSISDPGRVNSSIFNSESIAAFDRMFNEPSLVKRYYEQLIELMDTVFKQDRIDGIIDQVLGGHVPDVRRDELKAFYAARVAHLTGQIPRDFIVQSSLAKSNGIYRTGGEFAAFTGTGDVAGVESVMVNGEAAVWDAKTGQWSIGETTGGNAVVVNLVNAGTGWQYLDDGSNQGTAWREAGFDSSSWASGDAQLGYGDGDEATVVGSGGSGNRHYTTYFRKTFNVDAASVFNEMVLKLLRDDGASVYLNGNEIVRSNLPGTLGDNGIDWETKASNSVSGSNEDRFYEYVLNSDFLVDGENVLAVEVHQINRTSSDISFDLSLTGTGGGGGALNGIDIDHGMNRVLVNFYEGENGTGRLLKSEELFVWREGAALNNVSGTISGDVVWDKASGPYYVTSDVTVPVGSKLTIEPGVTVFYASGEKMVVNGQLIAKGTETDRITMTVLPSEGGKWNGVRFIDTDLENELSYIDMIDMGDSIEVITARLLVNNVSWSKIDGVIIIEVNHPKILINDSYFPDVGGSETIHGNNLTGDEYFTVQGSTFGAGTGYNDRIDLTNAGRPGPVFKFLNNLFLGGGDDGIDLDGADALIEGNVFMNFSLDVPRSSSSNAIATGSSGGKTTHIIVNRNVFINNDHAVLLKQDASMTATNNTFINSKIAAINFDERNRSGVTPGYGVDLLNNIFYDNAAIFQNQFSLDGEHEPVINADYNYLPVEFHELGEGNIEGDLRLDGLAIDPANLTLGMGSVAIGSGRDGIDMGALVESGAVILGSVDDVSSQRDYSFDVIGGGIAFYQYQFNDSAWSGEIAVDQPIVLNGLVDGQYTLRVMGRGIDQSWDDVGIEVKAINWEVNAAGNGLVINEVLADNINLQVDGVVTDMIELYNSSDQPIDLSGMQLSDAVDSLTKYVFSAGTLLGAGEYLVLHSGVAAAGAVGVYVGFSLNSGGEGVYLFEAPLSGGALIDSVAFGIQAPGYSIGRVGGQNAWALNVPTFGATNIEQQLGSTDLLRINEWLVSHNILMDTDFVELYNDDVLPVSLAGVSLSARPNLEGAGYTIASLSFVGGEGYVGLVADGAGDRDHLSFKLDGDGGLLGLTNASGDELDRVIYYSQATDYSEGINPVGEAATYRMPTMGFANEILPSETYDNYLNILGNIRITEIMYNPDDGTAYEYIELTNIGFEAVDLEGVQFTNGISFTFGEVSLDAGETVVLFKDFDTFRVKYGMNYKYGGEYTGKLSDGGEGLLLSLPDAVGGLGVLRFKYDDAWEPTTDGGGDALHIIDGVTTANAWGEQESWTSGPSALVRTLLGDYDYDGIVDVADVDVVKTGFGGLFSLSDLFTVRNTFGDIEVATEAAVVSDMIEPIARSEVISNATVLAYYDFMDEQARKGAATSDEIENEVDVLLELMIRY